MYAHLDEGIVAKNMPAQDGRLLALRALLQELANTVWALAVCASFVANQLPTQYVQ